MPQTEHATVEESVCAVRSLPQPACGYFTALGVGFPGIFYIFKLATRQEKPPYA